MPPSAPASQSLQERLLQLVQTLQFGWFVGHTVVLICTLRYGLSYLFLNYYSKTAIFCYRLLFTAAAATYGIVVYKSVRAKAKAGRQGSPLSMIADENVQYLAMALVWLFSAQVPLAMLPFAVYSVFHVATYTRSMLLPTITPPPPTPAGQKPATSALGDQIGRFVKEYYDASMSLVAGLEILLWFRLFGAALLFMKGSWILLVIYTVFLRSRISQSTFVQGTLRQLGARIDTLVNRQDVPPVARQVWTQVKGVLKQTHDATDMSKYISGQPPVQKKAQ